MPGESKKRILIILFGLLGISLIIGIVIKNNDADSKKEKTIKVGMTLYDGKDIFISNAWEDIQEYIALLNEEKGLNVVIEGVDSKHDQALQNEQIDNFINNKYDILVANTVERQDASTIIDKAQAAGIPLIFFNREPVPQDMKKWDQTYYIGSKAEKAGAMQGEILADAMEKGLKVDRNKDGKIQYVMLEGEYGHQDAILRTYHCIRILEERGFKMDNIATDTAMWNRDVGKAKMLEWLEKHGSKIEVVLSNNDAMALGAIDAMKEKGYSKDKKWIPVVGVDGIDEALAAIEEGLMIGTVLNDSDEQARCIVSKIYELITGEAGMFDVNTQEGNHYFWADHKKITNENINNVKKHNTLNKK